MKQNVEDLETVVSMAYRALKGKFTLFPFPSPYNPLLKGAENASKNFSFLLLFVRKFEENMTFLFPF